MYTLRKISENNGRESNICLGNSYSFVQNRGKSEESFNEELRRWDEGESKIPDEVKIKGFVTSDTLVVTPIYEGEIVYVMTENGKTFSRLD